VANGNENDIGGKVSLDITDAKANVAELNRQIKVIDSGFKAAAAGMDDWGKSEEGLQARIKSLNDITDLQRQKVANLTTIYEKVAAEKGENSKAAQDLLVRINKETEALNKNESEMRSAVQALESLGNESKDAADEAEKLSGGLGELDGNLKSMGGGAAKIAAAGIAAVGAAAVAAVAGIAKFANDSAKAMNQFQAQTGATAEEMAEFKEIANEIYTNNLGESMEDVAAAMSEVKRTTGETGESLKGLTESALLLRDTFGYEVNETTRTANTLMKQFGITGEQAMTLIAQGAQNGADKNGDLLDTLNEYSPQFKALGFSAEQFTDVLIQGAENGAWSIDKVGDAIKEFNIRAKDGSDSSAQAFQQLGLNADTMTQSFAAGGETAQAAFSEVISALEGIEDPVKRNQIGISLFGTQFEDLEAGAILALGNVRSQADMTADTLENIQDVKFNDLGSAFEGLKRQALGALQPVTDSATTMITGIVNGIRNGDWAGVGTAISEGFTNILSQLTTMLPNMVEMATSLVTGLINAIVQALPIAIPALADAAIQIINSLASGITEALPTLIPVAVEVIAQLILGLIEALPSLLESALSIVEALGEGILNAIPVLVEMLPQLIDSILSFITDNLPAFIEKAADIILSLVNGIVEAIPMLLEALPKIIDTIITFLTNNLPEIVKMGIDVLLKLIEGIIGAIPSLIKAVPQLITAIVKTIVSNLPQIIKMGIDIIIELVKGLVKAIPDLVAAVPEIITALLDAFGDLLGDFVDIGSDIVKGLWEGIKSMGSWIKDKVSGFVGGMVDGVKGVLGIHSPSRVFRDEVGQMIGLGMAEGITASAKDVNAAMAGLNNELAVSPVVNAVGTANVAGKDSIPLAAKTTEIINNFADMFRGANFTIRTDSDIPRLGQELGGYVVNNIRGLGGDPV
jgi:phage-related minor tail protein